MLYFLGCRNQPINFYDESNYILVRTDSSSNGLDRKLYVNKYDTAWKMLNNYFYDGKLLAKGFSYNGHIEGNLKVYDMNEKLMTIDSFHNGIKLSSKHFYSRDTSVKIFRNGKLEPFKSIDSLK
jgi:hypothetical protein